MFAFKLLPLLLACTTIASANVGLDLPKGFVYYEDIDTAYRISTSRVNWTTAKQRCCSHGGHLAVIDTWEKIGHIEESTSWFEWVWVGIQRDSIRDEWRDAMGDWTVSDLPWASMNPKPFSNCVSVSGLVTGLTNWPCDCLFYYVCEISGQYEAEKYAAECFDESFTDSLVEQPAGSWDDHSRESSDEHSPESWIEFSTEDGDVLAFPKLHL